MAQSTKFINIEPLNKDNYHYWKFRMEIILAENGVLEHIQKNINTANLNLNEEKRRVLKNDCRAKSLLIQCVSDSQLEYLRNKDNAFETWNVLVERYERKGLPGQLFLKRKLLSMKMKEGECLENFITQFEEVLRQLKSTGVAVDEDIICNLLMTLPRSYEMVVTVIENMLSNQLNYDAIKTKLLSEYEKRKVGDSSKKNESNQIAAAFWTDKQCQGCGKKGYLKEECWHLPENRRDSRQLL